MSPDESTSLQPGQLLGHYRLLERIGGGGMGVVWKALDTKLAREVAVKVLVESLAGETTRLVMFEQEAKAIAALNHPHIVTIYSVEESEGHRFLTMELVRGKTLAALVPKTGFPLRHLLDLAIPLTEAMGAAHRRGVTHRDLKPGNIMVGEEGRVKVLDFGLAKLTEPDTRRDLDELTTSHAPLEGVLFGTLPYMSPEQLQGQTVDHRSDLFSLGIVLYEMATGRRPFQGESTAALIASILKDEPVPLTRWRSDLPRQLAEIVNRCLAKDPRRRPASALEVRRELERLPSEVDAGRWAFDRSIAVLPFVDMSAEKDQDYLCEGIAEEIMLALSKVKGLRVAARPSAFRFRVAVRDPRKIGEELRVSTLLDGSVRKAGDRLRITVELIDVGNGFGLWSERYDREMKDIFAIQDEIAHRVVQALELTLSAKERAALHKPATTDIEAYDYYLRGQKFYYQYNRRGVEFARQLFSRAIELDPGYARAHAWIATRDSYLYMYAGRNPADVEHALAAGRWSSTPSWRRPTRRWDCRSL